MHECAQLQQYQMMMIILHIEIVRKIVRHKKKKKKKIKNSFNIGFVTHLLKHRNCLLFFMKWDVFNCFFFICFILYLGPSKVPTENKMIFHGHEILFLTDKLHDNNSHNKFSTNFYIQIWPVQY